MASRHERCFQSPPPPWMIQRQKARRSKHFDEYRGEPQDKEESDKLRIGLYKSEAKTRIKAGKHDQAIEMYTKALEINPNDSSCLTARAECKFDAGDYEGAQKDAEAAREIDNRNAKALLVMAESLYHQSEFEQALVCYHRAKRMKTTACAPEVDRGIYKCEEAIDNAIGEKAGVKLNMTGDLSYFDELQQNERSGVQLIYRMRSVEHRRRQQQKQAKESPRHAAPPPQAQQPKSAKGPSGRSAKSLKQLLGELYDDHVFLMEVLGEQDDIMESVVEEEHTDDAEYRKRQRDRREALQHDDQKVDPALYDDNASVTKHGPKQKRRDKSKKFAKGVHSICETELDYLDERCEFWMQQGGFRAEESKHHQAEEGGPGASRMAHIMQNLELIEADQADGEYSESLKKGHKTLRMLDNLSEQEQPRQPEMLATLYSLLGNAYYEMEMYPKAITYYRKDLDLSKAQELQDGKARAMDNLGRTYAKEGKYAKAIKTFEERVPTVQGPLESTWLYHEMGRCHLENKSYNKAVSCAEKAASSAKDTDDSSWKLNAYVLLAQAQVEMNNHQEALEAFENALELAKVDKDKPAADAIQKAMTDVKDKMKREITDGEDRGEKGKGAETGDGAADHGGDDNGGGDNNDSGGGGGHDNNEDGGGDKDADDHGGALDSNNGQKALEQGHEQQQESPPSDEQQQQAEQSESQDQGDDVNGKPPETEEQTSESQQKSDEDTQQQQQQQEDEQQEQQQEK